MLPATTPGVARRTYSTLPPSSSVARQPSTKYTDNPSYVPSSTKPRTNEPASYGTYKSGNPFADPPPRPERYYSHGSVPQPQYNSGNISDPEKYRPRSRTFGSSMRRRSCVIIFIVAAGIIAAIVVAATFTDVSHFWSNSSTNAYGEGPTKTSSLTSSSSVSPATETSHSAKPPVFWGLHNNATNVTYAYPNSTTSGFELPYTQSATAVPSSNITTIPYF
ncbi:hypothetical protein V1517DRAFT_322632 [Lipomyces orientalis]|uniref:Uncharacterized protein n=1 Tax=Lipomyces orientalis TaxID=1233043 RepID=A0ACC3TNZ2_9ASCO